MVPPMDQARANRIITLLWGARGLAEAARQLGRMTHTNVSRQNIHNMVRKPGGKVPLRLAVFLRMSVRVRVLPQWVAGG